MKIDEKMLKNVLIGVVEVILKAALEGLDGMRQ